METEQIQLELKKLNKNFNNEVCDYYETQENTKDCNYVLNSEYELSKIKEIWMNVLYRKCKTIMKSKSKKKNANEDEIKNFYNEHFKKYENDWELTDNNVPLYFLDTFEEEAINSSEKLKALIDFTTNKLKFKDDFYDDYFMAHIIDKLRFGDTSSLTKNDLFFVLDLNKEKNLSLSRLVQCAKKFELDYSDFEKLLSFAGSYELPDAKNKSKDYKKQANAFFKLIYEVIQNSKKSASNPVENFKIVQKIFVCINGSMSKFKHLFSEIDKYKSGIELSNCFNEHCINICLPEQNSGGGDIKVEIDYCVWFNQSVPLDRFFLFFPASSHDLNDDLNSFYDGWVSDFSDEMKKCCIDMTDEIMKELILNQDGFNKIVENMHYKAIQSPDDFNCLVNFIKSKAKDVGITSRFVDLIYDHVLNKDNVKELLKLDKDNSLSISDVSSIFNYQVSVKQIYIFEDITEFLLAAKDRFTKSKKSGHDKKSNDKKRKEDAKAFCDLLAYFLCHIDENEIDYIKFEQDIFDWIDKNISEVKFSKKIIKDSELKDVLKHRWVKLKFNDSGGNQLKYDFSCLQEKFESFITNMFQSKKIKVKYQDLNELSKAYDTLIDEFLKSKEVNQTYLQKVSKAGYEEKLKQALKVRESKSIKIFIKSIASNIIKSSDGLKLFLENVNKVMGKSIDFSNYDSFMNLVIDLIVDDSVDVGDILKVLKSFLPKKDEEAGQKKGTENKLKLTTLLKCCSKIKNGQKWNLKQVKKFLKYGFAGTTTKNISDSVDSFFKLLIIFISNADLKNKMYNSDPEKVDIEDNEDIKNNVDMTYEKFVNEILVCAKKIYFKQKDFSWSQHFNHCNNIGELQKILAEKNINIPELQHNKSSKNTGTKNEKIKNKEKNKINIETDLNGNHKNKIDEIYKSKKLDLKIKPTNNINPGEKDEKLKSTDLKSNDYIQITNQNESKNNEIDEKNNETGMTVNNKDNLKTKLKPISPITKITSSTDNQNGKASETYQKIDGIPVINNSKRENIQDQRHETTFTSTKKTSYFILIAKIVLYVLAVVALVVLIFGIIKTFWFLAILSFILCPVFTFIAHKIKYKTIDEKPNQISTGNLNHRPEIIGQYKNDELNPAQIPETIKDTRKKIKK